MSKSLAGFYFVTLLVSPLLSFAGISDISRMAALPAFCIVLLVFGILAMPLQNGFSRRIETEADRWTLETLGDREGFISMMERLAQRNLAEVSPPRWKEIFFYGHPSVNRRIRMAKETS